MLMAEWVLQVGMWSWLHPHGPGMDVAARKQQTAQPCWLEHQHGTCNVLLFPWVVTGTKQQFQEREEKKGVLGRI